MDASLTMQDKDFKEIQRAFVKSIKEPNCQTDLALEQRRLQVYQSLFFNNLESFIRQNFPVLSSLYREEKWQQLCQQFLACHKSQSPYFSDIRSEFLSFITQEYSVTDTDPAFLHQLVHYEWLEMEVMQTSSAYQAPNIESLERSDLYFARTAQLVSYPYPVHKISASWQPDAALPEPVYLIVYLASQYQVSFVEINAATAFALELVKTQVATNLEALVEHLSQAMPQVSRQQLKQGISQSLATLADEGILLARE